MRYGLIGKTLVHSYSKEIHEALGKYTYELFSLAPDELSPFISARDFDGLNVTIPYKKDILPMCDEVSGLASSIGAINTLYWKGHTLVGHNTDYEGFLYNAKRSNIGFKGQIVLILGSGGTSLMARKAAEDSGAKKVYIVSRSGAGDLSYDELHTVSNKVNVIINTTPVGTYPENLKTVIDLADFTSCEAVIDVIYNPFKTRLLMEAEAAGLKTAGGLAMLVAQATAAAGYFLGTPGAFECENNRIINKMLSDMRNITLIGMPGCGKSTIGRIISKKTGKRFVDMDDEIIKKAGITIPEIFDTLGETGFRNIESQVAEELGKQTGLIIATGGGTILRSENSLALKQNSLMVHIKRPIDLLPMGGRPLSKDAEALRNMEALRMPLYEATSDITFDNSELCTDEALADKVCKALEI